MRTTREFQLCIKHLLSWAELDTRASVLSERELDTVSTFNSSALPSSLADDWSIPAKASLSDWIGFPLRDAGSASTVYASGRKKGWALCKDAKPASYVHSESIKQLSLTYRLQQILTSQGHPVAYKSIHNKHVKTRTGSISVEINNCNVSRGWGFNLFSHVTKQHSEMYSYRK